MVICMINGAWWMICDVTGPLLFKFLMKVILGMGGIILPVIYFISKYQII